MRRFFPILLLLAGCGDGLFGPRAAESIAIEVDAMRASEATLVVGESVWLGVASRGRRPGEVIWRSDDPSVVTVSTAGEATGLAPGDTRIVAEAGTLADTIFVTVLAAAPAAGECAPGTGLRLARGEAFVTTAVSASTLCIEGPPEGARNVEQYLLVPFHAAPSGAKLQVEVALKGFVPEPLLAPGEPSLALSGSTIAADDLPLPSIEFHRQLRERERRDLARLVTRPVERSAANLSISPAVLPTTGNRITLNVNAEQSCTSAVNREVRVAAVSQRAIVLHDLANPAGGFTDAEYATFAAEFDEIVYPTIVENFGEPTDIDGNGRVLIVFTRAVNEMTKGDSEAYVAGFFYSRDLFPRKDSAGLRGCATSNVAEILYLMAPDPTGEINGNVRSKSFVTDRTLGVSAHELQHLISASRRLRILGLESWNEEFWLSEGLSHIAEELAFYASTGLAPRQNLQLRDLGLGNTLHRFQQFQATNFARLVSYLRDPAGTTALSGDDLATRGASWAFLRYAADRRGGSEAELWRRLIDSGEVGYANLASALGVSPLSWLHDWSVSLYTDDQVSSVEERFRQPSWDFRSIVPTFGTTGGAYPLQVEGLGAISGDRVSTVLSASGAAILRFNLVPGSRTELLTTSGGAEPPPALRLSLVRIR